MARELVYRYAFMSPLTCSNGTETTGNVQNQPACFFRANEARKVGSHSVTKAPLLIDPAP